jgi:hypothetical protein
MKPDISLLVLEESLDCVLMRVRWYWSRGHNKAVPESTRLAFNRLCDVLGKPDAPPYERISR